jgi:hypothetical protein
MLMKKIMHILLLSCLKATELIEKKLHVRLKWHERIQLKLHKLMCRACTNYEIQSAFIEKGISSAQKGMYTEKEIEQLKSFILDKIEAKK